MQIELDPTDTEGLQRLKDKTLKLRTIVLDAEKKPPLYNVSKMSTREKHHLQEDIKRLWDLDDDEITRRFNEICLQTIFDKNVCASTLPCEYSGVPELPEKELEWLRKLPVSEQLKRTGRVYEPNPECEQKNELVE